MPNLYKVAAAEVNKQVSYTRTRQQLVSHVSGMKNTYKSSKPDDNNMKVGVVPDHGCNFGSDEASEHIHVLIEEGEAATFQKLPGIPD